MFEFLCIYIVSVLILNTCIIFGAPEVYSEFDCDEDVLLVPILMCIYIPVINIVILTSVLIVGLFVGLFILVDWLLDKCVKRSAKFRMKGEK